MSRARQHEVSIIVDGQQVKLWDEYEIHSSIIEPADAWSLKMPWGKTGAAVWNLCRRDAAIKILIDDTVVISGFLDDRKRRAREGTIQIEGRDRGGRIVQESAPAVAYENLTMVAAAAQLVDPWFTKITLSDARNRNLRRGRKGRRIPGGEEPLTVNVRVVRSGTVHPGQTKGAILEDIVSEAGYAWWSSADGTEVFIGQPNDTQAPQFLLAVPRPGSNLECTVLELEHHESNGDRFARIICTGAGGSTERDYGPAVSDRRGTHNDGPNADGTGRDFQFPKLMIMPERDYASNQDATRVAEREARRRDFRRTVITADMEGHGQFLSGQRTIFAPNTVARVIDEEFDPPLDANYLIYSCVFRANRNDGETTQLEAVPVGTEIVL